jgi:cobyric acid synthase
MDNPKIEVKERMKAMNLIMHCYYMRSKLLNSEAFNKEFLDYTKKVQSDEEANKVREQEISRREKALQDYLDARKLTIGEFYNDPKKSERVF